MINYYYSRGPGTGRRLPFSNPLANTLVVLAGCVAILASLVLGLIAFLILGSLVMIFAALIGIRVWWLGRGRSARSGPQDPAVGRRNGRSGSGSGVIEGEFRELTGERPGRAGE